MAMSTPRSSARAAVLEFDRSAERAPAERIFRALLLAATVVGVIVLGVLIVDIALDGLPRLDGQFVSSYASRRAERTGVRAGIFGSLSLMLLVALFAIPIGV